MSDDGSKYVEIKIWIEKGKPVFDVKGGNPMDCKKLKELYDNKTLEHIGTILHYHSSPG